LVAAPKPTVTTSVGTLSSIDLRMMHHWSTSTWSSVAIGPDSSNVLLTRVPQLAFGNDYLLNGILGLSSLHIEHMSLDRRYNQRQTAKYRAKALVGFREAIAKADTHQIEWEAGLIMAILLLPLCSKDNIDGNSDLTIVNWVVLYRGLSAIIMMKSHAAIQDTSMKPIFRREWKELRFAPVIPRNLIALLEGITSMDSDFEYLESYCKVLDALGMLYGSLAQDGVAPELWVRVISWPSHVGKEFPNCAVELRPRALILLAHFLCFVKLVKGLWWVDDMADTEIKAIMRLIGDGWLPYMVVPVKITREIDKEAIARILLLGDTLSKPSPLEIQAAPLAGPIPYSSDLGEPNETDYSTERLYPVIE
jgi:hypothetical protein